MFAVDSLFNCQSKVISPSSSKNLIAGLAVGSLIGLGLRGWSDWMACNAFLHRHRQFLGVYSLLTLVVLSLLVMQHSNT